VAKLVALLGDVVATHKVAGFMLHLAKYFCSLCTTEKNNMDSMKIGPPRTKKKTLALSHQWQNKSTQKARKDLEKSAGVRWSELNQLPHWNPV
jgi:hypothetical protein